MLEVGGVRDDLLLYLFLCFIIIIVFFLLLSGLELLAELFSDTSLLEDSRLDTLAFRESNEGIVALANDEDVLVTGGKGVTLLVLHVHDIVASGVSLVVNDSTNTTTVGSSGDHAQVAQLKLHKLDDLVSAEIEFDHIASFNVGVGEADGATIVSDNVGDGGSLSVRERVATNGGLLSSASSDNTQQLDVGFLVLNTVQDKATLGIVQQAELLVSLLNGDNVLETSGVIHISSDLAVNLDQTTHDNSQDFTTSQGVFQAVAEDEGQGQAFTQLVGTSGRARSKDTAQLIEHPVLWGI